VSALSDTTLVLFPSTQKHERQNKRADITSECALLSSLSLFIDRSPPRLFWNFLFQTSKSLGSPLKAVIPVVGYRYPGRG
jgi:hypothetical protein